jgi:hypothetical protein
MSSNMPMQSLLDAAKCDGNTSVVEYVGSGCAIGDLPMWLVSVYLVGNTALSVLNFYWFNQMIKAVRKRFVKSDGEEKKKAQ